MLVQLLESRLPQNPGKAYGRYDFRAELSVLATKTVLLCGHDSHVSNTRRLLLEAAGYQVWVTGNSDEALQLIVSSPIDIVVICHSVPVDCAENLLLIARAYQPSVKILLLSTATPVPRQHLGDGVHDTLDGPARFLLKVKSMATMSLQSRSR